MRTVLLALILLISVNLSYSQVTYTFTGNGYWTNAANWSNSTIPPSTLPAGSIIIISHAAGDSCVLNIPQTISSGASLIISSGSNLVVPGNLLIDSSVSYPSVTICGQVWMTKNLDVATYLNGDPIPKVTDNIAWSNLTTGAYCYYNNDSATYAAIYGKLYNWYAVTDPRGLAPPGWHIPTLTELTTLSTCLGGSSVAGGPLKEAGTLHWNSPNTGATNSSGFTSLPSGYRTNVGTFSTHGIYAMYWSSTSYDATQAYGRRARYDQETFSVITFVNIGGFAVRCVKD